MSFEIFAETAKLFRIRFDFVRRSCFSISWLMLFLLYSATFLFCWSFSRNPFFAALLAVLISAALFCLASVFH